MKKLAYSLCVALLSLTFMACPYKSAVPIDDSPIQNINENILGEYEKKGSTSYTYTIEKESDTEYKFIRTSTSETSKSKPSEYYGYTSRIGDNVYLQVYRKSKYSSKKTYYLYRMSINNSNSILSLEPVTEHITEKFESNQALRDFIKKYEDLSFFFGKTEKYYKSE